MEGAGRKDDANGLAAQLISAAVMAGAYEAEMRRDPVLRPGFTKLADKYSARVTALADELVAERGHLAASAGKLRTAASPKC